MPIDHFCEDSMRRGLWTQEKSSKLILRMLFLKKIIAHTILETDSIVRKEMA